jgi:diguanylate cyclase (GGDEF)-like protein
MFHMPNASESGLGKRLQAIVQRLEERLTQAASVEEKIEVMNHLGWRLRIQHPERARALSQEALELAKSTGNENAVAASLVNLAFLDGEAGRLNTSLSHSLEALAYLKDPIQSDTLINAWYTLGWSHYYSGNYPAALEFGLKSLTLAREIGHREREAWCLDLVACTYMDVPQALQMYQSSFQIFEEMEHIEGQSRILNNWACVQMEAENYPEALELAHKSLKLAKHGGLKRDEINVMATIGEILAGMGNYSQAQETLIEANLLCDKHGRDISSTFVFVDLGHVYLQQNDLDRAEQQLLLALEAAASMEMRNEQSHCHKHLSEIYERQGRFEKALEHYKKFQGLKESISGEAALKQLVALRVTHEIETAQRDAEIQRLQKEKLQNELAEHKRVHAILEELATRDPLTNLFNRRHFMSLAEREWNRAARYQHPLCALMIDVDRFKQINDEHGHAVGDKALTTFANVLRSTLRSTEIAGRYGGDEFVVLLPETGPENGLRVARRICQAIGEYPINSEKGSLELTPSIGVACVTSQSKTKSLSELLNQADHAMYAAKKEGRGQVHLHIEDGEQG